MLFEIFLNNTRKFATEHENCIPPLAQLKQMAKAGYVIKRDGKAVKVSA